MTGAAAAREATRLEAERSARSGPPHPFELAAETLARPTFPTDRLDAGGDLSDDRWWAVVDIARGGDGRPDARFDRPHDLDDPLAFGDERVHHVAGPDLRRWLCGVAVDEDVPAIAQLRRHRPRLDEAYRAEPAINSRVVGHPWSSRSSALLRGVPQYAESSQGAPAGPLVVARPGPLTIERRAEPSTGWSGCVRCRIVTLPTAASSRRGAVSRFLAWTDGLPGSGWWVFPALAVLVFGVAHAILWATGRLPFGVVEPVIAVGVVYGPFLLAILAAANFVSKRSLVAFWPATGWPDADRAGWAAAFVDTPGAWGWVSLLIGVPLAIGSFLSAPTDLLGQGSDRFVLLVAYLPALILGYSMAPAPFVHTLRQLRSSRGSTGRPPRSIRSIADRCTPSPA
jgi:hypothetical protein